MRDERTYKIIGPQITQITRIRKKGTEVGKGRKTELRDGCPDEMRFARHGHEFHGVKMNGMGSLAGTDGRSSISVLPHATAYRLWGALELASRLGPDCELIVIGSPNGDIRIMEGLAHVLMPGRKVVSKTHLGGTSEHPKNVESFVDERAFILVTSAMHMKRAMRCFEQQGLKPVPYPVDFLCGGKYRWTDFLPSVDNLWKLNIVFREYLALGWYNLNSFGRARLNFPG